jgi:hypothetical protein
MIGLLQTQINRDPVEFYGTDPFLFERLEVGIVMKMFPLQLYHSQVGKADF